MSDHLATDGVVTTTTNHPTLHVDNHIVAAISWQATDCHRVGIRAVGVNVTCHQVAIITLTRVVLFTPSGTRPGIRGGPGNRNTRCQP